MSERTGPVVSKWPFFAGNVVLLAVAYFIYMQAHGPMHLGEEILFAGCGLAGAVLSVLPYVLEYQAAARLAENGSLASTVAEIRNLEMVAAQIAAATARWQVVQEHSANSVAAAREIEQKISGEAEAFKEFLQKSNDTERANLRLEVEKLRRGETDWLQVVVRQLDHTFALFKAAERTGHASLVEQLTVFQNSCRDTARRIGLLPLEPNIGDSFDPRCHRMAESEGEAVPGAKIGEIVATGYTYQGRLLRPAMVLPLKTAAEGDGTNGTDSEVEEEKTLL